MVWTAVDVRWIMLDALWGHVILVSDRPARCQLVIKQASHRFGLFTRAQDLIRLSPLLLRHS